MKIEVINNVPNVEIPKSNNGMFKSLDLNKQKMKDQYEKSIKLTEAVNRINNCRGKCSVEFYVQNNIIFRTITCYYEDDKKLIIQEMDRQHPGVFN